MRPSQNLLLPPRIYPPFQQLYATLSEFTPHSQNTPPFSTNVYVRPPRIYSSLLEYTPLCNKCIYMCDPPRIYPSLPPSQNTPPFWTTICDPPRIYPPSQNLPPPRIYPLFNNYNIMRRSRNLALPPRTYPPFSTTICDPPRIYLSLPEYTLFSTTICDPPRIYPSLPEYTPIFNNHIIIRRSQNLSLPPRIHPSPFFANCIPLTIYPSSIFYNYMRYSKNVPPQSLNMPLFLKTAWLYMWENLLRLLLPLTRLDQDSEKVWGWTLVVRTNTITAPPNSTSGSSVLSLEGQWPAILAYSALGRARHPLALLSGWRVTKYVRNGNGVG